ncbi:uncharacterized protein YALI1_D17731g [Yarrowia lipolytica]|uniref:Uncharacterized protein n=1 Tax=Yarrowia lipolytica TaxID=4952 RepID=A0A1D8NEK5_YARLL|nr:hypothetical protein YALI1_D17731g [Yarrowia lipolytica]
MSGQRLILEKRGVRFYYLREGPSPSLLTPKIHRKKPPFIPHLCPFMPLLYPLLYPRLYPISPFRPLTLLSIYLYLGCGRSR